VTIVGEDSVDETFLAKEFGNFLEERLGVRVVEEGGLGAGGCGDGGGQGGVHTGGFLGNMGKGALNVLKSTFTKEGRAEKKIQASTHKLVQEKITSLKEQKKMQEAQSKSDAAQKKASELQNEIDNASRVLAGNKNSHKNVVDVSEEHGRGIKNSDRHSSERDDASSVRRQHDYGNDNGDDHSGRHSPRPDEN
jgi:hypothetical protein